jgi:hypothetical protein
VWCHCSEIALNIYGPTVYNIDDVEDNLCKELECVFEEFCKYNMKILLDNFNAKMDNKHRSR